MAQAQSSPEGTYAYAAKFPEHRDNAFFRAAQTLTVSSLGLGSYLGNLDDATDQGYRGAVTEAVRGGINFIDTSLNYRHQRSERNIGDALAALIEAGEVDRDQLVICTKAGFLVPDAFPGDVLEPADVVGGMHSMAPAFLRDQITRSRANLRTPTIDVFYLHNPETQLQHVPRDQFHRRIRAAFETCEALASEGALRWYGVATWSGLRTKTAGEGLCLTELEALAREVAGPEHRFRFIQLPVNLAMLEGVTYHRERLHDRDVPVLTAGPELGITVVASASLLQARLTKGLPDEVARRLPEAASDAERAIQFARSAPGVSVALVGMSQPEHVRRNLAVAGYRPSALHEWFRSQE
ncbi:MAG: aldo/keto reductase [Bryobacteraceae bacterium]